MVERGVAQPGRVLGLGPRCRMFESCRPDQHKKDGEGSRLFYKWGGMRRTCEGSMFGAKEKGTRGRADFRQKIFRGNVRRTARRARREPSNHVAPTNTKKTAREAVFFINGAV